MQTADGTEKSAGSTAFSIGTARNADVASAVRTASEGLSTGQAPLAAFIVLHSKYHSSYQKVLADLKKQLALRKWTDVKVVGTSTSSFVLDGAPDCAVALLRVPNTRAALFSFQPDEKLDLDMRQENIRHRVLGGENERMKDPSFLLLSTPSYGQATDLTALLDFAFPSSAKFGGFAGRDVEALHEEAVFVDTTVLTNGAVGLALEGEIAFDVVVSQGARAVGPMLAVREVEDSCTITKVQEIGTPSESEGPPSSLFNMWQFTDLISDRDKKLAEKCTLLGLGIDLFEEDKQPEYVVRRILGFDKEKLAVAIEGGVRQGQILQYQVRDEESSFRELDKLLQKLKELRVEKSVEGKEPYGMFFFSDVERGDDFRNVVFRELKDVSKSLNKSVPFIGSISEGQIGPLPAPGFVNFFPIKGIGVSGSTFQHNATSVFAVLYGPKTS